VTDFPYPLCHVSAVCATAVGAVATIWATKLVGSAAAKAIDGDQATQDSSSEAADSKRSS
jgi:hypothetical protein